MTLPIERARSRRPVTWLTLIGVLLLPVVIGGILVASLYNPAERLDQINAAIVNEDEPVTIDDQIVPLGRQLTAGLVEGSDELDSNLTWTLSNTDDAAEGLADGTYDAVVTIPENFSAAATSTRPGETPEQATIERADAARRPDRRHAITAQVTTGRGIPHGDRDLAGLPRERVPRLHDARRPARRGRDRRARARGRRAAGRGRRRRAAERRDAARGRRERHLVGCDVARGRARPDRGGHRRRRRRCRDLATGLDQAAAGVQNQQLEDAANATASYAGDAAAQTAALALEVSAIPADATTSWALAQQLGALAAQCGLTARVPAFCQQLGGIAARRSAARPRTPAPPPPAPATRAATRLPRRAASPSSWRRRAKG